jgi:hypothetical protein
VVGTYDSRLNVPSIFSDDKPAERIRLLAEVRNWEN